MSILLSSLLARSGSSHWSPSADTYRTPGGGWLVKLDLAGVDPADVRVWLEESRLIVRGSRRDWAFRENYQLQSLEISYSRFERRFELSRFPSPAEISMEFRHGMLLVRIEPQARSKEGRHP